MIGFRRSVCALAACTVLSLAADVAAFEVFATSIFPPAPGDTDPSLNGVLKIDTVTGDVSTFLSEAATGMSLPTDVVVNRFTNTLYVSTQGGTIWHFDATTGAPLPTLVAGEQPGTFAVLPTAGFGDGVNSLLLGPGSQLLAATAFGSITPFDSSTGAQGADLASDLDFPSGLVRTPTGELIVSTGDPFGGPGALVEVDNGVVTTLVDFGDTPGVLGASNPTIVSPAGDYGGNGVVDASDYEVWFDAYFGAPPGVADGNGDGVVDAADYTVWRDQLGDETRVVVADLNGNQLLDYALDGSDGQQLAVIPPEIPDPLPVTANPNAPSNSPSEVLVTDEGTLLVSLLGLTQRSEEHRGALLEYSRDGTLLRTIADGLPPLSGIAFAPPASAGSAVPEPSSVFLALLATGVAGAFRRTRL